MIGNHVYPQGYRGFESLSLRKLSCYLHRGATPFVGQSVGKSQLRDRLVQGCKRPKSQLRPHVRATRRYRLIARALAPMVMSGSISPSAPRLAEQRAQARDYAVKRLLRIASKI
jgi:hypothetical protein